VFACSGSKGICPTVPQYLTLNYLKSLQKAGAGR